MTDPATPLPTPDQTPESEAPPRSRRAILAAIAAAGGAFLTRGFVQPDAAEAANGDTVKVGQTKTGTKPTTVRNRANATGAKALVGRTTFEGAAANSAGIWGESLGAGGVGTLGTANNGPGARGVAGKSTSGTGVAGTGGSTGVSGEGTSYGVRGTSESNYGVAGEAGYSGVLGTGGSYGVYGTGTSSGVVATSEAGYGVYAQGPVGALGIGSGTGYGVWGYNSASGGYGAVGQGGYRGVYGSGGNAGVYGTSGYVGVWGNATGSSGLNYGVYAVTSSPDGYAGVFTGDVYVSGFLTKVGGGFKIDHPMEPERRYLVHSFVESPEYLNVYGGTATLDARGRATVRLPRYFEAENVTHRFQLTPIGAPAPNLHVAGTVKDNRFSIAGGAPGQEVCWQVTGVRQDAWAKANPLRVEPLKRTADRGRFLNPEVHGKPATAAIHRLHLGAARDLGRKPRPIKAADRLAG